MRFTEKMHAVSFLHSFENGKGIASWASCFNYILIFFCHLKDSMLQIMSEYFSYWTFISTQQSKYYLWSVNILITILLVSWASWHCIIAEKWNHVEDLSEQNSGNDESQVMKQELKRKKCASFCLIEEMLIHIGM